MGTTLNFLLRQYQKGDGDVFGCSYINPPIGNYVSHETTTNANVRHLQSHFDEAWCQGGTRKDDKAGHWWDRWLCHITDKGPPEQILKVLPDPSEHSMWWWTRAPDDFPEEYLGVQWWHRSIMLKDCMCRFVLNSPSSADKFG